MLLAILGLLPSIPPIISGIEHFFGHGNGPKKKDAAMAMVGDMLNLQGQVQADSATMAYVDAVIEATVVYLNASGKFTHAQ